MANIYMIDENIHITYFLQALSKSKFFLLYEIESGKSSRGQRRRLPIEVLIKSVTQLLSLWLNRGPN